MRNTGAKVINLTDEDDIDRFEDFLDDMGDDEYERFYEIEATDKQKSLINRLREVIPEPDIDIQALPQDTAVSQPTTERKRIVILVLPESEVDALFKWLESRQ